jgi:hypothetical protein
MKVVNLRKEKYTHYIGRGSIFGNPFKIGKDGNRKEVIKKYEKWVRGDLQLELRISYALSKLGLAIYALPENAILGCYCKPLPCHGDVIIKIWKELHNETP